MHIKHVGRWANRIANNDKERIFQKHWKKANASISNRNGGYGILTLLLYASEEDDLGDVSQDATQYDAANAATVIQWLGSTCGMGFLTECLDECGYDVMPRFKKRKKIFDGDIL